MNLMSIEQLLFANNRLNVEMCERLLPSFNAILPKHGINTPLRLSHFLAQIMHESCSFKMVEENLGYSESGLLSVFPKYFSRDGGNGKLKAGDYARKPEAIANVVYGGRLGNGDSASGDGWRYRGRGLIQLTGKNNYSAFGKHSGIDAVGSPGLLSENPDTMTEAACWYWRMGNGDLNPLADRDDLAGITRRVNGGTHGIEHRKVHLDRCRKIFG